VWNLSRGASFPAAEGNAPAKTRDETPASYEGGLMFLAAGPEKVAGKKIEQ